MTFENTLTRRLFSLMFLTYLKTVTNTSIFYNIDLHLFLQQYFLLTVSLLVTYEVIKILLN